MPIFPRKRAFQKLWILFAVGLASLIGYLPIVQADEIRFSPAQGQLSSPFGYRLDPVSGAQRFHGGIDIAASYGAPVFATQPGFVLYSGPYGGYGNMVLLRHGSQGNTGTGIQTLYAHNSALWVKSGDWVERGQVIAQVGSTGKSTGPHLHFEVHSNQQYVNPIAYLVQLQSLAMMPATAPAQNQTTPTLPTSGIPVEVSGENHQQVAMNRKRGSSRNAVELILGEEAQTVRF